MIEYLFAGIAQKYSGTWCSDIDLNLSIEHVEGQEYRLRARAFPHSSWMKYGAVRAEVYAVLPYVRHTPNLTAWEWGGRELDKSVSFQFNGTDTAYGEAKFFFEPNWQVEGHDPHPSLASVDLGCRGARVGNSSEFPTIDNYDCDPQPAQALKIPSLSAVLAMGVLALVLASRKKMR